MSDTDPRPRSHGQGFSTRAIRAASRIPSLDQTPTSVPIFQTATFASADAEELGRVAADARAGFAYSRISNPTTSALGAAYAELAGGEAGLALASGMGAIHAALASLLRSGDRVVAPTAIYGSTRAQMLRTFGGFGVQVDSVDTTDLDAVAEALAAAPTKVLYAETIANPTTAIADHAALADLAHRHGATYVVDNTFASPYVCRPLELARTSSSSRRPSSSAVTATSSRGSPPAPRSTSARSSASRSIPGRPSVRSMPSSSCGAS